MIHPVMKHNGYHQALLDLISLKAIRKEFPWISFWLFSTKIGQGTELAELGHQLGGPLQKVFSIPSVHVILLIPVPLSGCTSNWDRRGVSFGNFNLALASACGLIPRFQT